MADEQSLWPIVDRFPGLASVPRAPLRERVTPVERVVVDARAIWIKRDDLTALPIGGNKVRSLEFFLGGVRAGDRIVTVGPWGSTHALTTAIHGSARGAEVTLGLWPQIMNPVATVVREATRRTAAVRRELPHPVAALAWLWWRGRRGDLTIPSGGTSPLGILGHVNAALELSGQIDRGEMPRPDFVVVPLGSGGTAAGLALGFAIAGVDCTVVAARVVPRIIGRRGRVHALVRRTSRLIGKRGSERVPRVTPRVVVADGVSGGGYGRPLHDARQAATSLRDAAGIRLDDTYSAKALAAVQPLPKDATILFWLTFDGRWLDRTDGHR